ncbi:MAG: T9SS type A sorting domain-containing protein [Cytophagales bacterium]|nr:T9SS type A sorting domain-containing protein [Cytophagales bacterium]
MKQLLTGVALGLGLSLNAQTVVSSGGETYNNSATVSITIGEPVINTHTGNGGTTSQGFQQGIELVVTSVNDGEVFTYDVFPNPTSNYVILNSKVTGNFSFSLSDAQGRVLLSKQEVVSGTNLHFEKYPTGIYFVNIISDDNKHSQTFKIIRK